MLVRYHMTRAVRSFAPGMRAQEALEEMRTERFRFGPVLDGDELVGVVTERDLLRLLPGSLAGEERQAARPDSALLVAHAMTRNVIPVGPNVHVEDAARILLERRINGLPVLENGALIGVITTSDLLRTLMENDGAREGQRMTLLLPASGPGLDLAKLCATAGLEIHGLMRHRAPSGGHLASLRVGGSQAAVEALLEALRRGGAVLVEGGEAARRAG